MRQLMQTNDPVLISFVEALLKDNGIGVVVLDQNMSVLEGSIGILQRRVMVREDDYAQCRAIFIEADLDEWLKEDK